MAIRPSMPLLSTIFILAIHTTTSIPTSRALLQSDIDARGENTTAMGLKLPEFKPFTHNDETSPPNTRPSTPSPDNLIPSKPTEQQAETILKLLLANLDHGDVRTVAMKLLPEYKKLCTTNIDCEELHSALRRLYLTRYSELQLSLHRMDKLGLLLRRVQYLIEQSQLDAGIDAPPYRHRRRTYKPSLKRVDHKKESTKGRALNLA
jgi:hypothetical protein